MKKCLIASIIAGSFLFLSCASTDKKVESPVKAEDFGKTGNAYLSWCNTEKAAIDSIVSKIKTLDGKKNAPEIITFYNNLEIKQSDALNKSSLFQMNHPEEGMRKAAMSCEQIILAQTTDISLDTSLFKVISSIDSADSRLSSEDRYFLNDVLVDFKRNGVDKDDKTREKIKAVSAKLSELEQKFFANISGDKKTVIVKNIEEFKGLPEDFISARKPNKDGNIILTTDWPDYYPVMIFADNEVLREKMWRTKQDIAYPANSPVFIEVLKLRRQKAELLGYKSWAHYSQEKLMIENPDNAMNFIKKVKALATESTGKDMAEMLALKKRMNPAAVRIEPWDSGYYQRLVKKEKFNYDPEEARKYFEISKVMDGIFKISSQIFGVTFNKVTRNDVWHPSVQSFDVVQDSKVIGQFELDLYPRPDKYKHFAMFSNEAGVNNLRLTRSAIVGNFPEPVNGKAYLAHDEVQTLFHEFGHLLHSIFAGNQKFVRFSGTNCQWDFVEVPSQLNEEWIWNADVLKLFATNDAGEPIPAALVEKMKKAEEFAKGITVSLQMYYAMLSLSYYLEDPANLDHHAFEKKIGREYSPYPIYDETHMTESFGHLLGYGSNYYTYMWSLVIVKDLANIIKEKGIMNPEIMAAYKNAVLNKGGAEPAKKGVNEFLKRDFSFEAFEKWLKN